MDEDQLIEYFRQIIGLKTNTGYFTAIVKDPLAPILEYYYVPNFLIGNNKAEYPEVVITPFISNVKTGEETVYCEGGGDNRRFDIKQYVARFQMDIYANTLPEINAIKKAIGIRFDDFVDPEFIVFQEDIGWVFGNNSTYHNDDYDLTRNIVKLYDIYNEKLIKVNSLLEVDELTNSWFLDNTGLYVNPTHGTPEDIQIYEILNGLTFPDGDSAYDKGIHNFWIVSDRMLKEKDQDVKRRSIDFMIDYRTARLMNRGTVLEEMIINVEKED